MHLQIQEPKQDMYNIFLDKRHLKLGSVVNCGKQPKTIAMRGDSLEELVVMTNYARWC